MRKSQIVLTIGVLSFLVSGVIDGVFPQFTEANYFIHIFIIAFLTFSWVAMHAYENRVKPPKGAKILSALILPIGIPYYFLKAYGFKSGGIKVLLFFLLFLLSVILYGVPAELLR